ncbi:hypothetical protein L1987_00856 [Smallanthus sonchifolius]|uniref:Uncharacterized protein n=1 Tax=Smallanthus sonchifolius TaxID=185202 RepID=A0ACB9K3A6_9ASTR|nr:hypothetical protein L1987_00856 [Smallanthus sonchifolius]
MYLLSGSLDKTIKVWGATESGNIEEVYKHDVDDKKRRACYVHAKTTVFAYMICPLTVERIVRQSSEPASSKGSTLQSDIVLPLLEAGSEDCLTILSTVTKGIVRKKRSSRSAAGGVGRLPASLASLEAGSEDCLAILSTVTNGIVRKKKFEVRSWWCRASPGFSRFTRSRF